MHADVAVTGCLQNQTYSFFTGVSIWKKLNALVRRGCRKARKANAAVQREPFRGGVLERAPEKASLPSCPAPFQAWEMPLLAAEARSLCPSAAGEGRAGGVPARGRREGRGGTSAGTGAPPGWLCLCVSRLLVTEPFSSACEMSVVTELRPTKKGPFTVRGGEVKTNKPYC